MKYKLSFFLVISHFRLVSKYHMEYKKQIAKLCTLHIKDNTQSIIQCRRYLSMTKPDTTIETRKTIPPVADNAITPET